MSKVITRPAKAANPTPAPVVAVEPVEAQEIARIKLAFRALDSILWSASQTPLDQTASGDSDRLLRTASVLANHLASDNTDDGSGALENEARTVAALVRASRMVPDDVENAARREWIERAGVLLAQITGDPVEKTIDPYKAGPRLAPETALYRAGEAADALVAQACKEIESMADALLERFEEDGQDHAVFRALTIRIREVLAVPISYFGRDDLYTFDAGFTEVWQGSRNVSEVL